MNRIKSNNLSIRRVATIIFLALYPIVPGYFRIAGVQSQKIVALLYFIIYFLPSLNTKKLLISKRSLSIICIILLLRLPGNLYHGNTTQILNTLVSYVLALLPLLDYLDSKEKIEDCLHVLCNVSMFMCFSGLFEFFTQRNLWALINNGDGTDASPDLQMRGIFARSEASFGQAIPFAIYLSINAFIALYFYYTRKEKKYLYMFAILVVSLMTTISRAPIIVFVFCLAIFLRMMRRNRLLKGVFISAGLLGIIMFVSYFAFPRLYNGIYFIMNVVLGIFSEDALARAGEFQNANPFTYRIALYSIALNLIKGHYLFGTGQAINEFAYGSNVYVKSLHFSIDNAYLSGLVTDGILGLSATIYELVVAIKNTFPKRNKDIIYKVFFIIIIILALNWFSVAKMGTARIWMIIFAMIISINRPKVAKNEGISASFEG